MTIGQQLRKARTEFGLSQDDLAALSGITQATISDIETGAVSSPRCDTIIKLAFALQVTTDYLLREEVTDAN